MANVQTIRVTDWDKDYDRFWRFVDLGDTENDCHLWTGTLNRGYGRFRAGGRLHYAHRWLFEKRLGALPPGYVLDHLCESRNCVNLRHLDVTTQRANILRGTGIASANAAKTHCKRGHPFDEANTDVRPNGSRRCIACHRQEARR